MCASIDRRGFTLVELLVASVLIATGLVGVAGAFSAAARAQGAAARTTTAARLAEAKLAEIQALGIASGAAEGSFAQLEVVAQTAHLREIGTLADYYYRWEIAAEFEGLARAQVSVWHRDRETNPLTLVCYLPSGEAAP